jgi:hypothetical protein
MTDTDRSGWTGGAPGGSGPGHPGYRSAQPVVATLVRTVFAQRRFTALYPPVTALAWARSAGERCRPETFRSWRSGVTPRPVIVERCREVVALGPLPLPAVQAGK